MSIFSQQSIIPHSLQHLSRSCRLNYSTNVSGCEPESTERTFPGQMEPAVQLNHAPSGYHLHYKPPLAAQTHMSTHWEKKRYRMRTYTSYIYTHTHTSLFSWPRLTHPKSIPPDSWGMTKWLRLQGWLGRENHSFKGSWLTWRNLVPACLLKSKESKMRVIFFFLKTYSNSIK